MTDHIEEQADREALLEAFEEIVRAHENRGSLPPEEAEEIEDEYDRLKGAALTILVEGG